MDWYPVLYTLAITTGALIMIAEGRRRDLDVAAWSMAVALWCVGGIIGAELPHAVLGDLVAAKTAVGAVAGATLALFVSAQLLGVPAGKALDATATAIPLAGAIARLGCFAAECCDGIATGLPVGVFGEDGVRRHPTQLYEAAVDVAIAAWISGSQRPRREGHRFLLSLAAMSLGRFAIEFVRDGEKLGPLSLAQWIVGPAAIMALALVARDVRVPQLRRRPMAVAGVTALALQVPAISTDTLYPRNYVSIGGGWFGAAFDWRHESGGSCGVREQWTRTHTLHGGALEAGYRRQLSATRGVGIRVRPFSAREHASASRDFMVNGFPSSGPSTPFPAYTVTHRGATVAGDLEFKYLGLTMGGTIGRFYPFVVAEDDRRDYRKAQEYWGSVGLRLGTQKAALEVRIADEQPSGIPLPGYTIGIGVGNGRDSRVRFGASELGPFITMRHVRPGGFEVSPMVGVAHQGLHAGLMAKQWFRTDRKVR